jgi:hypothetical protein
MSMLKVRGHVVRMFGAWGVDAEVMVAVVVAGMSWFL